MDTPNAPNPTNPNAQDENVDVVQGPMVPNQAQVPAGQIPAQIPVVPVQGQVQVGKNLPVQPPPQPVPI